MAKKKKILRYEIVLYICIPFIVSSQMRQTWAAMLQMVPQLSKDKANVFVENTRYSCPRKVFDAMNDENIPASERIQAMHTCFSKGKNGTIRQEPKLSRHIFKLMTVGDPDASLSEDPQ